VQEANGTGDSNSPNQAASVLSAFLIEKSRGRFHGAGSETPATMEICGWFARRRKLFFAPVMLRYVHAERGGNMRRAPREIGKSEGTRSDKPW